MKEMLGQEVNQRQKDLDERSKEVREIHVRNSMGNNNMDKEKPA